MTKKLETATFGAGCFWWVEESFRKLKGVISTEVGYSGGKTKNPSYEEVCSGETGHAESARIKFDPSIISYEKLLDVFWRIHDPTTLNRQGPDLGKQYRSVIFYHNKEQKETAEKSKANLEKKGMKIVTEIVPATDFYKAEEYHQKYLLKKGSKVCH